MSIKKRFFIFLCKVLFIGLLLTTVLVLPLRWLNPATTSFILQDNQVESPWIYQRWTSLDNIAPIMQVAVIASEDQRFPDHYGIDFVELKKILSRQGVPTRGASTITQQLVKNLFLWPNQSMFRKMVEVYVATVVELLLPKQRILELYLNVIEYGEGVYGISDASRAFFNKKPLSLNRIEASLLAAVLPQPKKLNVASPSPYVYNRALDIRFAIGNLGGVEYLKRLSN